MDLLSGLAHFLDWPELRVVQDETSISSQFAYDKKKEEGLARPGTDRLAAVKQAYKNQFMSNFRAAQTDDAGYNPNATIIQPKLSRKRPSRWTDE